MTATTCSEFTILEVSDGTVTVDLLSPKSGFCLVDWDPVVSEPKGGGVWKDSQLADGRQLGMRKRANVADTYTLAVRNWSADDLIRDTQNLRRLLEKACAYRTAKWQDEPVWIKRQGRYEAYPTYTLIEDYRTPQDRNPHGNQYFWDSLGRAAFPDFKLIVEHEFCWRADPPGEGTCVEASGQQVGWQYAAEWILNTGLPTGRVFDLLDASCGNLLAADDGAPDVLRSANGTVWNGAATPPTIAPYVLMEASDGDIFLAGQWGANVGVWRSQDCGVNWAQRSNAWGTISLNSMVEFGTYIYLCTGNSGIIGAGVGGRIIRSNNDGAAWAVVRIVPGVGNRTAAALCVGDDGYLYAQEYYGTAGNSRIVRSSNGTTWEVVHLDTFTSANIMHNLGDGYLYAGGYRASLESVLLRSSNGTDWSVIWSSAVTGEPNDLMLASDGYYYMGCDGSEVWISPDAASWTLDADFGVQQVYSLVEFSFNNHLYAGENDEIYSKDISSTATVGRAATCEDEVFVANKCNIAQLTHVKVYDASAAPPNDYTDWFPAGGFPYNLLPAVMANNDAFYAGINTGVVNSGPFDNLVFDITTATTGIYQLTWQYSDGVAGWPALNVHDETSFFSGLGVNSVHWVPPSDWAAEAVDGVTALWVRAIVSNVTGNPTGPQQDNRDVYTCNWARADVDELQVPGDIPALMQCKFHNRSDEDGYVNIDELDLLENRVVVGLRSLDRGSTFVAYLNCSDEQNPFGVIVSVGANTAFVNDIDHPTGRSMQHTTTGASAWSDECTFTLASTIARDFFGSFHAYFRGQEVDRSAAMGEVLVRLQVRTGSGGVVFTTDHKPFRNLNDWQLLDFGGVDIPASGLLSSDDLGDIMELVIQIWSSVSSLTVNLYDLNLTPTDEWALDAVDKAMEDDSGVAQGWLLDVDSVRYPKRDIRSMVRKADPVGLIRSIYQSNTPAPAMLQANADQRLWFLTARGALWGTHTGGNNQPTLTDANASFLTSGVKPGQVIFNVTDGSTGTVGATVTVTTISDCGLAGGTDNDWDTGDVYLIVCPNWRSEPWNDHSVQFWGNARYLSMRGAR